ncbi:unnamed protein product [Pedinophyceae sp. YPF-701]|nr:unnamed protein product [Pedinophyceae sp. YPF-701]
MEEGVKQRVCGDEGGAALNKDIVELIIGHVARDDPETALLSCPAVCREWRDVVSSSTEHIWRHAYGARYHKEAMVGCCSLYGAAHQRLFSACPSVVARQRGLVPSSSVRDWKREMGLRRELANPRWSDELSARRVAVQGDFIRNVWSRPGLVMTTCGSTQRVDIALRAFAPDPAGSGAAWREVACMSGHEGPMWSLVACSDENDLASAFRRRDSRAGPDATGSDGGDQQLTQQFGPLGPPLALTCSQDGTARATYMRPGAPSLAMHTTPVAENAPPSNVHFIALDERAGPACGTGHGVVVTVTDDGVIDVWDVGGLCADIEGGATAASRACKRAFRPCQANSAGRVPDAWDPQAIACEDGILAVAMDVDLDYDTIVGQSASPTVEPSLIALYNIKNFEDADGIPELHGRLKPRPFGAREFNLMIEEDVLPTNSIESMTLRPSWGRLYAGTSVWQLCVWDIQKGASDTYELPSVRMALSDHDVVTHPGPAISCHQVASRDVVYCADLSRHVMMCDTRQQRMEALYTCPRLRPVSSLAYEESRQVLVWGDWSGDGYVYDIRAGRVMSARAAHRERIWSVSADAAQCVTGGLDGCVCVLE